MARRSLPEHEISDWDPMSEDYYDPNFNSYPHGPGSRLDRNLLRFQPRSNRGDSVYELYVENIPAGLSEIGMRNVFLNFGSPLTVYKRPAKTSHTWGMVSYASHREAEFAIRELDKAPPFYFRVKFSRSPAEKERIRRQREDDEMLSRAVESEPYPVQSERSPFDSYRRGIGRGRGIALAQQMGIARHCPGRYNAESDADDMDYFSPYVPGAYDEANRMIMERKMNRSFSSLSGERWVSMGRGYFPASKRPSFNIELKKYGKDEKHMLAQAVEQMYESWIEYGQKECGAGKSGNCLYCRRVAYKYCQQCLAWYCTKSCQQKDWPRHRTVCIPKLSASDAGSRLNHAPAQVSDAKRSPDARPEKSAVNQARGQNVGGDSVDFEHGDSMVNSYGNKEEQSKANFKENHFKQKHHDGLSRNTDHYKNGSEHRNAYFPDVKNGRYTSNNSFSVGRMGATEGKRSSVNERLCVARQKESGRNASLATDSMSSLQIQQESELVNSLVDSGQVKPVGENMPKLAALRQDSPSAEEVINMYDAAVSVVPKMESLNISISTSAGRSKSKGLRKDRFARTSSSAVHVEGEQYKPAAAPLEKKQQHTNSLPQKLGMMKETVPRMSASNTPMKCSPDKSLPRPKQSHRSTVDGLKVGTKGCGEFKEKMIGGDYSLVIISCELKEKFVALLKELEGMKDTCESSPVDEKYSPNIGDMVLAPAAPESAEDGAWSRARILSVGNSGSYRVTFCDIGRTETVKVVKQMSKDLASIPEFAARCSIISSTIPKEKLWSEEYSQFLFTVTGVDDTQKAVTCVLESKSHKEICMALVKRWVPAIEDEGLKTVEVKNNDPVVLQVFFNQKSLYVRPASSNAKDMFGQLNQDIGQHCIKAVELDHLPVKNELVACRFLADGNYYRAKVLDVSADTVKLVYVDFGNVEVATKDKLKPLTDSLKRIPCMVVKVGLKDALDRPLTVAANEFLSDLVGREVELKLILTGSRKDEVLLILPDGSSMNDTLNTMLEPGWKRDMAAGKDPRVSVVFLADDVKYLELPVGQTVDFLVCHKLDSVTVMGCEANGETMFQIHSSMTDEMNVYCNSTPEDSYVPRYSELCFARFEGARRCVAAYGVLGVTEVIQRSLRVAFCAVCGWRSATHTQHRRLDADSAGLLRSHLEHHMQQHTFELLKMNITNSGTSVSLAMNFPCFSPQNGYLWVELEPFNNDKIWYRAMCLSDESVTEKSVIFLDFGNMAYVKKEDIRRMIKEYAEVPAVAVMCVLHGLENANETLKNRACKLVQVNNTYKARVVSCPDPGSYVIEFPHVTEALIKENLLPSEK